MLTGSKHTEEAKARISESLKGNHYALGYKHSEETKRKVRENHAHWSKGKNLSEETKRKISEAKKGTIPSIEARENMHKAQLKRYEDPEERRKTGELSKGRKNCLGKHWKISEEKLKDLRSGYNKPERIAKIKNSLCKHHIYMDKDDNKTMMMTRGKHRQLHTRAYDYLVKINKVDDYIKWFNEEY